MKKILILLVLVSSAAFAQKTDREEWHKKIDALKTAHITQALQLSSAEAEKFWPVYNLYDEKMHDLHRTKKREIYSKLKNGVDSMNSSEANTLIDRELELEQKELQYRKELIAELKKIISPSKIIKLKKAEDDFKKELLKRYRQRKDR
ncbi:sensor of ECF-type sigma factor [uncultured Marixanthomonas sp.]|uniref:sensor of ECF-type sigma factor n=1 Tax=uncultured Marixanthomonas sp. TaxID=757245 RepID=UPI0030D93E8B